MQILALCSGCEPHAPREGERSDVWAVRWVLCQASACACACSLRRGWGHTLKTGLLGTYLPCKCRHWGPGNCHGERKLPAETTQPDCRPFQEQEGYIQICSSSPHNFNSSWFFPLFHLKALLNPALVKGLGEIKIITTSTNTLEPLVHHFVCPLSVLLYHLVPIYSVRWVLFIILSFIGGQINL